MSQLGEMWLGVVSVQSLEHLANLFVQLHPFQTRELVVQDVAYERVREAEPSHDARQLGHEPGGHCFINHPKEVNRREAARSFEAFEVELSALHGSEREDVDATPGLAVQ